MARENVSYIVIIVLAVNRIKYIDNTYRDRMYNIF